MNQKPEKVNHDKFDSEIEPQEKISEVEKLKKQVKNLEKRNKQTLINVAISIFIIMAIMLIIAYDLRKDIDDNKLEIDYNSAAGKIHLSIKDTHRTSHDNRDAVYFETTIQNNWVGPIGPYSLVVVASWIKKTTGETHDQSIIIIEEVLWTEETFTRDCMLFIDDFDNGHALISLYYNGQEIDSKTAFLT